MSASPPTSGQPPAPPADQARFHLNTNPLLLVEETLRFIGRGSYQGEGLLEVLVEPADQPPLTLHTNVSIYYSEQTNRLLAAANFPEPGVPSKSVRAGGVAVKVTATVVLNSLRRQIAGRFSLPEAPDDVMACLDTSFSLLHLLFNKSRIMSACMRFAVAAVVGGPAAYVPEYMMYQQMAYQSALPGQFTYRAGGGGGGAGGGGGVHRGGQVYYPGMNPGLAVPPAPYFAPAHGQVVAIPVPVASPAAGPEEDERVPVEARPFARRPGGLLKAVVEDPAAIEKALQKSVAAGRGSEFVSWVLSKLGRSVTALLAHDKKAVSDAAVQLVLEAVKDPACAKALLEGLDGTLPRAVEENPSLVGPLCGAPGQTGLARELRPHLASLVSGLDKARFARLVQAVEGLEEAQCLELVGGIVMSPAVLRAVSTNEPGVFLARVLTGHANRAGVVRACARTLSSFPGLVPELARNALGVHVVCAAVEAVPVDADADMGAFLDLRLLFAERAEMLAAHSVGSQVVRACLDHFFFRDAVAQRLFGPGVHDLVASRAVDLLEHAVRSEPDQLKAATLVKAVMRHQALLDKQVLANWLELEKLT